MDWTSRFNKKIISDHTDSTIDALIQAVYSKKLLIHNDHAN